MGGWGGAGRGVGGGTAVLCLHCPALPCPPCMEPPTTTTRKGYHPAPVLHDVLQLLDAAAHAPHLHASVWVDGGRRRVGRETGCGASKQAQDTIGWRG